MYGSRATYGKNDTLRTVCAVLPCMVIGTPLRIQLVHGCRWGLRPILL